MNSFQVRTDLEKKSKNELISDCINLHQSNHQLKKENAKLKWKLKQSNEKVESLERILKAYDNAHTPPSKQRFPKRRKSDGTKKIGRPKGCLGSTRTFRKPDRIIRLTAKRCPYCKRDLRQKIKPKKIVRIVVEDIPESRQTIVTEFFQEICECPFCGKIIIPKHKDLPDSGNFGNNLLANVALMKYEDRLTYRKIRNTLKRQYGLAITHSSIIDFIRRVSLKARKEYEKIVERIKSSKVVHIDETKIKVDGKTYWIWIFHTKTDTLTMIRKSRGESVLEEVLGREYLGTIICDGWKVYSSFTENLQRCWAHLLREAKYLSERNDEAKPLYEKISLLYKSLSERLSSNPSIEERKLIRKQSEEELLSIICRHQSSGGEIQKLTDKISNGFKWWFTFITNPLAEPTNNAAERELREHVIHKKIIGTLRNEWGTFAHETMMTVLQTWDQQGYNTYQKLLEVLRS